MITFTRVLKRKIHTLFWKFADWSVIVTKLEALKNESTDRQKVNAWLDHTGEFDDKCRNEVLEQCVKDIEARKYYVNRYELTVK